MLVRRGVRVHLQSPARGVRLYEYDRTLIHQKIVIIDEAWAHVGSTNFDSRSLALNEEIGVGVLDGAIALELEQAFEHDLRFCREWKLEDWRRRPRHDRLFDGFAYLLHDQL